ncbi:MULTISPECIES: hypothetical protein [unclassified Mesorhizobium]|uniref:hypothetical protein n=1 Tax=unclassified Mesorhizobium TaxID=325217 RepID=UPI00167A47AF|nr:MULTISPECIES: hypothetical protein [unclassified Mesorhizobium]
MNASALAEWLSLLSPRWLAAERRAKIQPSQLTNFAAVDISTRNRKKSDLGC